MSNKELSSLMKKNLILMKRNCFTTVCEILFPIILILILAALKFAFPMSTMTNIMTEAEFLSSNSTAIVRPDSTGKKRSFYGLKVSNPL